MAYRIKMHLCLTKECISSGLHLSIFFMRSQPPFRQPMALHCTPAPIIPTTLRIGGCALRCGSATRSPAPVHTEEGRTYRKVPEQHREGGLPIPHQQRRAPSNFTVMGTTPCEASASAGGGVDATGQ